MQPNNFRGFSSNNRYNNQNQQIFNQFNYQRNQNNLFLYNSNSNSLPFGNSLQNSNNFPVRINPLSSFQMGSSSSPIRPTLPKKRLYVKLTQEEKGYFSRYFYLILIFS